MHDDVQLLREFGERNSEAAFRTLVERHAGMVHGTAMRLVRDATAAEEIAQAVFILLARKAPKLSSGTVIAGWLHQTTRYVALEALRAERRRQQHHQEFAAMNDSADSAAVWNQITPHLDEALNGLGGHDRNALVLRFLEGRSFAEVGTALGISEAAAKMRVSRALDKLRQALGRRGATVTVAVLLTALTAHAASAAPAALAIQITGVSLAATAPGPHLLPLVNETLKLMTMQKLKTILITAVATILILGGVAILHHQLYRHFHGHAHAAAPQVRSFEAMAGEWEGTFDSHGDGAHLPRGQKVWLSILTSAQGRVCDINMRLLDKNDRPQTVLHFSHTLNAAGDRIVTEDDPKIMGTVHDGRVTEAMHDPATGEWRAAFQATRPGSADVTECQWVCSGDRLTISRRDVSVTENGDNILYSDIILRRKGA